jgi:hypothetical protein
MKKTIILLFALFLIVSCGDDPVTEAETGTLGGNCYPNRTCNDGLECSAAGVCIDKAAQNDSPDDDGSDGGTADDTDSAADDTDSAADSDTTDTSDTVPDDDPAGEDGAKCGNGTVEDGEICEIGDTRPCSEIDSSYKSGNVECNDHCNGWLTVNCMASELEPLATFPARTHKLDYLYNGFDAFQESSNQLDELWTAALFNASITMNGETYSIPHPQANTHWIAAYYDSSSLSFYQNSYSCDDEMECQYTTPAVMFGAALSSLKAGNELSIGISDENQVNMIIEDFVGEDDCVMLVGYGTLKVDSANISAGSAGNFKFTTSKIGLYLPAATPEGDMSGELEIAGFKICK